MFGPMEEAILSEGQTHANQKHSFQSAHLTLSLFRFPKGISLRLEKIQRNFPWGGANLVKKIHLVNWNAICLRKEFSGLGIRNISTYNKALLGK